MKKKILIIGGSYFIGRVFTLYAARQNRYQLHLLNRGTYPFHRSDITEYVCDRNDSFAIQKLPVQHFDALVDFCAYHPGDLQLLVHSLPSSFSQYIYISSASVCAPASHPRDEGSPLRTKRGNDQGSVYAYEKRLLEQELADLCAQAGISYTIFRPCYVYGPYNYAPRESFYFQRLFQGHPLPRPIDAGASFSMVYVTDIAKAICAAIGAPAAINQIYHLAAPDPVDYMRFLDVLAHIHRPSIQFEDLTAKEISARRIPLPFPTDENDLFIGEKASHELNLEYTSLLSGLQLTYHAFKPVYSPVDS